MFQVNAVMLRQIAPLQYDFTNSVGMSDQCYLRMIRFYVFSQTRYSYCTPHSCREPKTVSLIVLNTTLFWSTDKVENVDIERSTLPTLRACPANGRRALRVRGTGATLPDPPFPTLTVRLFNPEQYLAAAMVCAGGPVSSNRPVYFL